MKRSSSIPTAPTAPTASAQPTEDAIREYAYYLYVESGYIPDRDLDNWLEAEAHLRGSVSQEPAIPVTDAPFIDARNISR